ncbi:efflux RND transporter periplasmic adaptor subunit [Pseudomonas sp. 6D_7.1_Bac1]|uniref:efflux RND transporter periplasmic adaptor subunit n=1 Tax=Pseudomonas sp. 6D_7.1_Bac1 TaxID=2971615 RepID=UPI0021C89E90|nr:efflux RND transporter periplasmic adaptor subunit [Pseudomonas sp. 6D_7.1_Bac1]MCU1748437.1 efflux RND transporter periplasmic adaptor subunit [Pseudomonas sp. 6D_7.1_Bac1]
MSTFIVKGALLAGLSIVIGAAGGYWFAQTHRTAIPAAAAEAQDNPKNPLYWYDPMYPQQKFDKPGPSPFMDMQLVPRYADAASDTAPLSIDPGLTQNLGLRLATVTRGALDPGTEVAGVLTLNERDVAVIQARAGGFVERVYARAPGDVLKANAPLADILVPEWAAAQEEFLALKRTGDASLLNAARQRLKLAGMPAALISQVERQSKVQTVQTLTSPIGGVLQTLEVREGMNVTAGQTLARVNGLSSVWLSLAVPESQAGSISEGQTVSARLPAFPGKMLSGTVSAVLPETNTDSRTLRVRIELANPQGQLRPGMTAQVQFKHSNEQTRLWVPSEALIRTGRRVIAIIAKDAGHYQPVEVEAGQENAGKTVVLRGLQEGQQVVSSGQFLIDSEASLKGIVATPLDNTGGQP